MNLRQRINEGLEGKFKGLDNGFKDINKYIFGIQRGIYYLIGGASGTYKTTLLDYMIRHAVMSAEHQGIECNIFYYSFEIDELTKKCNWISGIIYDNYGITIPPETIKGLGDFRLNTEQQELVFQATDIIEQLFDKINFRFTPLNPTGVYSELWKAASDKGVFSYEIYKDHDDKLQKRITGFTPANSNAYNLVALDHLYLLKKERGFQTKEVIDKMSEYFVALRNMFGYTPIILQQFNQSLSNIDRQKFKGLDLSPAQNDFRDSTSPYADADVVLGLMCPYKLDMSSSLGYDITKLKDKMIMLKIIKNRLSRDGIAKGLYVKPESGKFFELPEPNSLEINKYYNNF